jgi:hypothetical protein
MTLVQAVGNLHTELCQKVKLVNDLLVQEDTDIVSVLCSMLCSRFSRLNLRSLFHCRRVLRAVGLAVTLLLAEAALDHLGLRGTGEKNRLS